LYEKKFFGLFGRFIVNQESIPAGIPVIREKSSRVRKARAVLDL
jgi:hypothetical protein